MEPAKDRIHLIQNALQKLKAIQLTIHDETPLHAGHTGARKGGGHFAIDIVSNVFSGKNAVQRHRMIYEALDDLMTTEIHAISIQAKTPEEV